MKNKSANKKKWLSLLGLTALTAVVAVPAVALTACSTTTDDNGGNTNPNPSPGPGGGGDTTPTKKEIKIDTTAISRVGSVDDLLNENKTLKPLDEVWEQYLAKNPAEVIVDYENLTPEEMTSLKIEVIDTSTETDTSWGGTNSYEQWKNTTSNNVIPFEATNDIQISASNIKDLKDNITNQIGSMVPNKQLQLVNESIPSLDVSNDFVNIHVKETTQSKKDYAFKLPVSDINFVSKFDIKVTTTNENLIAPEQQQVDFKYDIGIDKDVELAQNLSKDLSLTEANGQIEVKSVLTALHMSDSTYTKIDQKNASESTNVYNVKWEEPAQKDLQYTKDNAANDTLTLYATPLPGHYWDDTGSAESRPIVIDKLNIKVDTSSTR